MLPDMTWYNPEDRDEVAEIIVDNIVAEMTFEQMRIHVWDALYSELSGLSWTDLIMYAEEYAPDLAERMQPR